MKLHDYKPLDSYKGTKAIKHALKTMPETAEVYRMLTRLTQLTERIRKMILQTTSMEIITTYTEAEALLLEANLIKSLKPRYNILLRDDKSYPWLVITKEKWPRIDKHRGKISKRNYYWGPFASVGAVNQTLELLQKIFLLRSCEDSIFNSRRNFGRLFGTIL